MNESIDPFQALEIIEVNEMHSRREFLTPEEVSEIKNASSRTEAENVGNTIYYKHQEQSFVQTYEEHMDGVRSQIDDTISNAFIFSTN